MPKASPSSSAPRPDPGYRDPVDPPGTVDEPTEPAGEILAPSSGDHDQIARLDARARNRRIGLLVGVAILVRAAQTVGDQPNPAPSGVGVLLLVGAAALGLYAALSWAPRGVGPAFVRLEPGNEVTAGFRLAVNVVLRPRDRLVLDPLQVRLVARKGGKKGEVVYETFRDLAERHTIEAGQAVRLATTLRIPEDVPVSAPGQPIRWRVEVTAGEPPRLSIARSIRVVATRRARRRGAQLAGK